ncbi:MAG: hypothetical protein WDN04_07345 [Rhodospirillales bacterium]
MSLDFIRRGKKIESLGIEYDEEALAIGEYDDILVDYHDPD